MKITATLKTISRFAAGFIGSSIERVAHESVDATFLSGHTKVVVRMAPDGSATVDTYRLAEGATPDDLDPAVWTDDVSVTVFTERTRPTAVTVSPETLMFASETLGF
jgi:hypothetical protein